MYGFGRGRMRHLVQKQEIIMEKIIMAHGAGGKTGSELMSRIFGKYFKNEVLDKMEDAAVVEVNGRIAVSTDSFVVTPLEFKGGDIGKLCVCGTCNDLLMMGAVFSVPSQAVS